MGIGEADFRRHAEDIKKLLECQIPPPICPAKPELSPFEKRCRSQAEIRDPWRDIQNPEKSRQLNEADLVINQVLPRSPANSKLFCEITAPRRADSSDRRSNRETK